MTKTFSRCHFWKPLVIPVIPSCLTVMGFPPTPCFPQQLPLLPWPVSLFLNTPTRLEGHQLFYQKMSCSPAAAHDPGGGE